jgi:hypothetical protein
MSFTNPYLQFIDLLLIGLAAMLVWAVYRAVVDFGTSQRPVFINVINEDKIIKAYMLNNEIYLRRVFFKLDPTSKLPFGFDSFPIRINKSVYLPFLPIKVAEVPMLVAVRTIEGHIVPVSIEKVDDQNYRLADYLKTNITRMLHSDLSTINQSIANIKTSEGLMEAIINQIKENWIGFSVVLIMLSLLILIGINLKYSDALIKVSENMKIVSEKMIQITNKIENEPISESNTTVQINVSTP